MIKQSLLVPLLVVQFNCHPQTLRFESMEWLNSESPAYTLQKKLVGKNKTVHFLVEGFQIDEKFVNQIDSFAHHNKPSNVNDFASYKMYFYKKSHITNAEHLKKDPKDFDRYSFGNDLIFLYKWSNGEFLFRFKFKDGVLFEEPEPVKQY